MKPEVDRKIREARIMAVIITASVCLAVVISGATFLFKRHSDKLQQEHRQEMQRLKVEHRRDVNAAILRRMSGVDPDPLDLPEDVRLELKCTPIKGRSRSTHPYGDYTVFVSPGGHKYHCRRTCCGATIPVHYFDLPKKLSACMKCRLPLTLESIPPWYLSMVHDPDTEEDILLADWKVEFRDDALYMTGLDGVTYCYYNAPESLYQDLISDPSPERFFRENIKDKLPYVIGDNGGPMVIANQE